MTLLCSRPLNRNQSNSSPSASSLYRKSHVCGQRLDYNFAVSIAYSMEDFESETSRGWKFPQNVPRLKSLVQHRDLKPKNTYRWRRRQVDKSVDVPPKGGMVEKAWNDLPSSKQEDTRQRNLDPSGDLELPYHRKRYNQEHDIEDHFCDPHAQRRGSHILTFRITYTIVADGFYGWTLEYRV